MKKSSLQLTCTTTAANEWFSERENVQKSTLVAKNIDVGGFEL